MAYDEVLAGQVRDCLQEDAGAAAAGTCGASHVRLGSWRTCDQLATGRGPGPDAAGARLIDITVRTLCAGTGATP